MIIPRGITFERWSAELNNDFPNIGIPTPVRESDWKEWVMRLLLLPQFVNQATLLPHQYNNWQEWAQRFYGLFN
jgi:hypothetical protein